MKIYELLETAYLGRHRKDTSQAADESVFVLAFILKDIICDLIIFRTIGRVVQ